MRPQILYHLSRHLAIRLENSLQHGEDGVPVYLCHPLDVLGESGRPAAERQGDGAVGVLYLHDIVPEKRYHRAGTFLESAAGRRHPPLEESRHLRRAGRWIRLRYSFIVVGGSLEDELGILGAVLQTLLDRPFLSVAEIAAAAEAPVGLPSASPGDDDLEERLEVDTVPVEWVAEPPGWRELGLEEHHRVLSFDVSLPLPSRGREAVQTIVQRDVDLGGRRPDFPED